MKKLLFVSQRPFYPDSSGGGQHSALYLFNSLKDRGWKIEIICSRSLNPPKLVSSTLNLVAKKLNYLAISDHTLGYPCWRVINEWNTKGSWLSLLEKRLQEYQPDLVLGHCYPNCFLLNHAKNLGYKTFYFARCADHFQNGVKISGEIHLLANSPFTASEIRQSTGREAKVILPFVNLEQYRVKDHQPKYITFINPIPEKGIKIVLEVIRLLPQEKFLIVKGKWVTYNSDRQNSLLKSISHLPNIDVWEHQQDMKKVYSVTDILLFPSQYDEAFGRVVLEAQINQIPVVASNTGGIPYSVGRGGVLIEPKDDACAYAEVLKKLRLDRDFYQGLSILALENALRDNFNPQYQVNEFIEFTNEVLESSI
jgi:glycosyltransferase involved in cell wall biosynthesis